MSLLSFSFLLQLRKYKKVAESRLHTYIPVVVSCICCGIIRPLHQTCCTSCNCCCHQGVVVHFDGVELKILQLGSKSNTNKVIQLLHLPIFASPCKLKMMCVEALRIEGKSMAHGSASKWKKTAETPIAKASMSHVLQGVLNPKRSLQQVLQRSSFCIRSDDDAFAARLPLSLEQPQTTKSVDSSNSRRKVRELTEIFFSSSREGSKENKP